MNQDKSIRRITRTRAKTKGTQERPRLSVFRSNKFIYGQIINDEKGNTLIGVSEKELSDKKMNKTEKAKELGKIIAGNAKKKKINKVVFDRGGYAYHGRVKAFAEGAREGGLDF
ncbi:50S ribosomal protein L18 [Patescibacteria group bacterium]|nr:50S ribosomal protein L18 [Patescibacteria group bacterium]